MGEQDGVVSSEDTFTFCIEKGMHISLKSKNGQLEISGEKRLYMLPYENSSFFFFKKIHNFLYYNENC